VGCWDYITKRFLSTVELVARLKQYYDEATPQGVTSPIEIEGLVAWSDQPSESNYCTRPLEMDQTEYRLLKFLMTHQERAYSKSSAVGISMGWEMSTLKSVRLKCTYRRLRQRHW